jgi:DNA-binding CsgD family transcriptional regulator
MDMSMLSPRQREILALVAAGRTSKEIASELGISERTVNWHLSNAFVRLGASSRAEAVAITIRDAADKGPRRRTASSLYLALAFVLTLLIGVVAGVLIAGWDLMPVGPAPGLPSVP